MPKSNQNLTEQLHEYIFLKSICNVYLLISERLSTLQTDWKNTALKDQYHHITLLMDDAMVKLKESSFQDDHKDCVASLQQARESLIETHASVSRYMNYYHLISNAYQTEKNRRELAETKAHETPFDEQRFLSDCYGYLTDMENQNTYIAKETAGGILAQIPFHMSRFKFYDYIQNCLSEAKILLAPYENAILKRFLAAGMPLERDYGAYLGYIKEELAPFETMDFTKLPDETFAQTEETLKHISSLLDEYFDYTNLIYNILNTLKCLFVIGFPLDDLLKNNFKMKDFYFTLVEYLSGEIQEELFSELCQNIEKELDEPLAALIDECKALDEKITKAIEKLEEGNDELKTLLDIKAFIDELFYADLTYETFLFEGSEENNEIPYDALSEETLAALQQHLSSLPNRMRKLHMQNMFSLLPTVWSTDETMHYIKNALDQMSLQEKFLTANEVIQYINNRMQQYPGQHHHEHSSSCGHEHSDSCSCGHHHHEHSSSCGHEHNDSCDCGHHHH